MRQMFQGCKNLTELDLSGFDTGKVTDMRMMFHWCTQLKSLNVESFNTSNVTNMQSMFAGNKLTSLDVSSFDTSRVSNFEEMFAKCSKLKEIIVSESFILLDNGELITKSMFEDCPAKACVIRDGKNMPVEDWKKNTIIVPGKKEELTTESVRWLQRVLKKLEYYTGQEDGKFGDMTNRALKEFKSDYELNPTSSMHAKTIQALCARVAEVR